MRNKLPRIICPALIFAAMAANAVTMQPFRGWAGLKRNGAGIVVARCTQTPNPDFAEVPDWWELSMDEITNLHSFARKLEEKPDKISAFLDDHIGAFESQLLRSYVASNSDSEALEAVLVIDINKLIDGPSIYDTNRFRYVKLRPETDALRESNPHGRELVQLNRMLLEDTYPTEIVKKHIKPGLIRGYWKDGVITSDIEVVFVLQGTTKPGPSHLVSTYRLPHQGDYYLIFADYYNGHYQALEDYRVVPLGYNFESDRLTGKTLDEQIDILVRDRLDQLNNVSEEKKRLEEELDH
jgi:hypothetical protein